MLLLWTLLSAFICSATEREYLYNALDDVSNEIKNLSLEISTILAVKIKKMQTLEMQQKKILQQIYEINQRAMNDLHQTNSSTEQPTNMPSRRPTSKPTNDPTLKPTQQPTEHPTIEWSPKKTIVQGKSARRNKKDSSANLVDDDILLADTIKKHHKIKPDRIQFYDFEFPEDSADKIKRFEQFLLSKPEISLILTSTTNKIGNRVTPFHHSLDSLLLKAMMALFTIKPRALSSNLHIQYSDFMIAMFKILPLDGDLFDAVCNRMMFLFPGINCYIDDTFKNFMKINASDPDAFNIKMSFAQFTFEEILYQQINRLEMILNNTEYGKSNVIPSSFRREILDLKSEKRIQKDIINLFCFNETQKMEKRLITKLKQSLFRLELIGINFNMAAIIYQWRMNDIEKNHGTIAVFAGTNAYNKMLDGLLDNFGCNSSNIQRLKVTETKKPRTTSQRSRKKQSQRRRSDDEFNITLFNLGETELNGLENLQLDYDFHFDKNQTVQKKDKIAIVSINGSNIYESNLAKQAKKVLRELNDDTNDVVIVALYNVPIESSQITGSAEKHWVFTKIDIAFHRSISMIYNVMKRINFTAFDESDKELLLSTVNSDIFHLTSLDNKIFYSILKSMNQSNKETFNLFGKNVETQYTEMKKAEKYKQWRMNDDMFTDQMVDCMLDFMENTVKMILINKQFELNQILSESDYIQSDEVPSELNPKTDLKFFFVLLRELMIKIRNNDHVGLPKLWQSFETLQYDIRVRKVALSIGKILYDRKQSNCAGVVRIICDPVISEIVQIVINALGSNVTMID